MTDGSPEVFAAFPDSDGQLADVSLNAPSARTGNVYGKMNRHGEKSADARYHDRGATDFARYLAYGGMIPGLPRVSSGPPRLAATIASVPSTQPSSQSI